jgi:putative flavoprotein involved in K+ transport
MKSTHTLIIGGGQAGLAMSRCLSESGVDHVVLERGRIAERWRSERWDSLRLLTPRWQSRLPGWSYDGPDQDGYMTMPEVIDYLDAYARSFDAPVQTGTTVRRVERRGSGYRVVTDRGVWSAANVVIATGQCDKPFVPEVGLRLPRDVAQIVPSSYRNPRQLPEGGVLVVGASSSGIQLADEIHRSGRPVTLAVGRHTRLPRTYRGRDILWWFDAMGIFDEKFDGVADIAASRRQPSLQLVGRPDRRTLDLSTLQAAGVRLVGRVRDVDGHRVLLASDLADSVARADSKLEGLLRRVDEFIRAEGLESEVAPGEPMPQVCVPAAPDGLDLRAERIGTIVWATGYRRSYPWLRVPVLDARGEIRHEGGITAVPGLYVLGLQFLRRRKSSFIDGVGDDARVLSRHLAARLRCAASVAA